MPSKACTHRRRLTTHVYTDANANGAQDAGDTNLAGVTVSLLNANGSPPAGRR